MNNVRPSRKSAPFNPGYAELFMLGVLSLLLCLLHSLSVTSCLDFVSYFSLGYLAVKDIHDREISHSVLGLCALSLGIKACSLGQLRLLEAVICIFVLWGTELVMRGLLRREGMGFGDIKVLGALSLLLGLRAFDCLFLALMIALISWIFVKLYLWCTQQQRRLEKSFPLIPALFISFVIFELPFIEKASSIYELITLAW